MSIATSDTVYLTGKALMDRISSLATFDPSTLVGSAFWNLSNHLAVARGDVNVGGTPVSAETRAATVAPNGEIQPAIRNQMIAWINTLLAAYPAPVVTVPTSTTPGTTTTLPGASFLDGEIFGIPTKWLLIGAGLYLFLGKK